MQLGSRLALHFYGIGVAIDCDDHEILERVATDFSYFATADSGSADVSIRAHLRKPDYEGLPPLKASVYSPRNVCYTDGMLTYIDYFGRALCVHDRSGESLDISSDRPHLLHEILYLSILSRVGERLERRRIHRVHALGIERHGEAALFMMPSGGGKTTLALEFLSRDGDDRLISEDSPLIDESGRVLPFPLRIGVAGDRLPDVPERFVRRVERMEFEPKNLISLEAFEGKIAAAPATPKLVFVGERTLGTDCTIRRVSFFSGLKAFGRHMIVGVGLYQGVEFLLRTSVLDLVRLSNLFVSRFLRAVSVLRQSDVFAVELGRDPHKNAAAILAFLETRNFGRGTS